MGFIILIKIFFIKLVFLIILGYSKLKFTNPIMFNSF